MFTDKQDPAGWILAGMWLIAAASGCLLIAMYANETREKRLELERRQRFDTSNELWAERRRHAMQLDGALQKISELSEETNDEPKPADDDPKPGTSQ
jgi:hypothetical protein